MKNIDSIFNMGIDDNRVIGSGSYGVIIDNFDGTATKIMRYHTTNPKALIKIKELNLDNFYKLFDIIVFNDGNKDYLKAYKMEVIKEENINLNKVPINYLITNINILMNSLKILSDNYIIANDLHEDNLIINSDGIYVIDCDSYKYNASYSKELIYLNNIDYLKKAIYYNLYKNTNILKRRKLNKLFKDYDLTAIIKMIENSSSMDEYLKK